MAEPASCGVSAGSAQAGVPTMTRVRIRIPHCVVRVLHAFHFRVECPSLLSHPGLLGRACGTSYCVLCFSFRPKTSLERLPALCRKQFFGLPLETNTTALYKGRRRGLPAWPAALSWLLEPLRWQSPAPSALHSVDSELGTSQKNFTYLSCLELWWSPCWFSIKWKHWFSFFKDFNITCLLVTPFLF